MNYGSLIFRPKHVLNFDNLNGHSFEFCVFNSILNLLFIEIENKRNRTEEHFKEGLIVYTVVCQLYFIVTFLLEIINIKVFNNNKRGFCVFFN